LDRTQIGNEGLKALCESEIMLTVEKLTLPHNGLDNAAIDLLAESDYLPNLVTIDLYRNRISQSTAQRLKQSPKLKRFKFLQMD
ncbi:MAG: hypothetical protein V3V24_07295, partial [Nitrospinaceae bacterium]